MFLARPLISFFSLKTPDTLSTLNLPDLNEFILALATSTLLISWTIVSPIAKQSGSKLDRDKI